SPFWTRALDAEIMPVLLTTASRTSDAARAVITTRWAAMVPEFEAPVGPEVARPVGAETEYLSRPSPSKSMVKAEAPPIATLPVSAAMRPWFEALAPDSTA